MVIRAGGETWLVEESEAEGVEPASAPQFMGVTFRPQTQTTDRVQMRWVPRSTPLTPRVARRLFELAGERVWRDPRSGTIHQVHLVDVGPDEDDAVHRGAMQIRFRWKGGEASASYRLPHPLGLASGVEMQAMLDRALGGAPRPA